MLLEGKVALVTGAARGIGLATARRLAAEGAAVVLADVIEDEARRAADALAAEGRRALAVRADVSRREDVAAMVRAAEEAFGRLDILVNNAGIGGKAAPIEQQSDADWDTVMAVNLKSVYLCCQAAIPGMKARRYGRIVNVASIAGKEGNPNMVPYSTAKAGVIGLTKALAKEVGADGISVNAVSPAVIETTLLEQLTPEQVQYMVQRIPLGRVGQPEEVAALIAWLASDECTFTTGQCVDISGGRATY
ncbi:MAG TPA: SDR family NAD(P)-dependent oxidoreductase [Thermomicrobiales bacterium]|nr:SDR family NAD(P)-dependent oxidoreductase [Thermomicrobiales bacterium]